MTAGERVRSLAFWTLDRVRGGRMAFHLRDLAQLDADPTLAAVRNAQRLNTLLTHACQTTAYYRQMSGAAGLSAFPVLTKSDIREHRNALLSSRYHPESLITKRTSGSYGTPMAFHLTRDKVTRNHAALIHYGRWAGYEVGVRYLNTRTRQMPGALRRWTHNQALMNPTHMTEEWLAQQRQLLRVQPIKLVVGYPSALTAIAAYCKACGDTAADYSLQGLVAIAEPLHEDARRLLEATFGCPALSRYAAVELGVLAHECPGGKQHHLNRATFVFELLDREEDRPAALGEPGRVVVTDLWSHAMPLIRYEVGDVAVMAERCACGWEGPVLTRIEGRLVEMIYDTAGDRVSPIAISAVMDDVDHAVQFQFVQHHPKRYTMRLCTLPGFAGEELIRGRLMTILGPEADLSFDYVGEIPPLRSGKRPYVINEMGDHQPQKLGP